MTEKTCSHLEIAQTMQPSVRFVGAPRGGFQPCSTPSDTNARAFEDRADRDLWRIADSDL
jgi:hypothetical protein